jgi:hypothetical protein
MTTCDMCKYRKRCFEAKRGYASRFRKDLLCTYCGCIEDACHCGLPNLVRQERKPYVLLK